ncbi:uncharacterized protein BDW47DRAFT_84422 [Aspergillus candidus]|uniref:Uncharacterized protein n=1 Tax=Aspergillus candidus TaxID=41067 RepID=A0A2I2F037_ASPCN|nr:hypothetical protein BDW47DRAFT_84422 [Aspergillus candidus]PLB34001.1 hypothetical protein BDW47DRAFT_84422 [Aspergillus candidus]
MSVPQRNQTRLLCHIHSTAIVPVQLYNSLLLLSPFYTILFSLRWSLSYLILAFIGRMRNDTDMYADRRNSTQLKDALMQVKHENVNTKKGGNKYVN